MTRAEALAEAQRRWGMAISNAWEDETARKDYRFCVGTLVQAHGRGDSWEAAFADADRRTVNAGNGSFTEGGTK